MNRWLAPTHMTGTGENFNGQQDIVDKATEKPVPQPLPITESSFIAMTLGVWKRRNPETNELASLVYQRKPLFTTDRNRTAVYIQSVRVPLRLKQWSCPLIPRERSHRACLLLILSWKLVEGKENDSMIGLSWSDLLEMNKICD